MEAELKTGDHIRRRRIECRSSIPTAIYEVSVDVVGNVIDQYVSNATQSGLPSCYFVSSTVNPFENSVTYYASCSDGLPETPADLVADSSPVYINENGEGVTDLAYRHPFDGAYSYSGSNYTFGEEIDLSLSADEEFKPAAECLEMLAKDQENFETEHQFMWNNEVAGAQVNCDVSWQTSCAADSDHDAYMRISIGTFMAAHSEELGSLDGSRKGKRPTFGSHIQTPPNNRRPITLLKPRSASSSQSRCNETIVVDGFDSFADVDRTITTDDLAHSSVDQQHSVANACANNEKQVCSLTALELGSADINPAYFTSSSDSNGCSSGFPAKLSDIGGLAHSIVKASGSRKSINQLVQIYSNMKKRGNDDGKCGSSDHHESVRSDLMPPADEMGMTSRFDQINSTESHDGDFTASTKSYSWSSSLPNGSKIDAVTAVSANDKSGVVFRSTTTDGLLPEPRSPALQSNGHLSSVAVSYRHPGGAGYDTSRSSADCERSLSLHQSCVASTTNSAIIVSVDQPDSGTSSNADDVVLAVKQSLPPSAKLPFATSELEFTGLHLTSDVDKKTTGVASTLRLRDIAPTESANGGVQSYQEKFLSPRRSSILPHKRSHLDDSSRFQLTELCYDQSSDMLSSTIRPVDETCMVHDVVDPSSTPCGHSPLQIGNLITPVKNPSLNSAIHLQPMNKQTDSKTLSKLAHLMSSISVHSLSASDKLTQQNKLFCGDPSLHSTPMLLPSSTANKANHGVRVLPNLIPVEVSALYDQVLDGYIGVATVGNINMLNRNQCTVYVRFEISGVSVDGCQFDNAYEPFVLEKNVVQLEPGGRRQNVVKFIPRIVGQHVVQLVVITSALNNNSSSLQPSDCSSQPDRDVKQDLIQLKATAERLVLQVHGPNVGSDGVDFGKVPWSSRASLPLTVINASNVPIPVKMIIIPSLGTSNGVFTFADEFGDNKTPPSQSIFQCNLQPSALADSQKVLLRFNAPQEPLPGTAAAGALCRYSASVKICLDTLGCADCLAMVQLTALAGTLRLHTNVEVIRFVVEPGQFQDAFVTVRNAGLIPFTVSMETVGNSDLYSITPGQCVIEPNDQSEVLVHFTGTNHLTDPSGTYDSVLLMFVEPEGPSFEIPIFSRVASTAILTAPSTVPTLLATRHCLSFGGVDLGKSAELSVTLKSNVHHSLKLRTEIRCPAKSDYQIIDSYVHKELRMNSKEVVLNPEQECTLRIRFSPSSCSSINGKLRIRVMGTSLNYAIILTGHGGVSQVFITSLPVVTGKGSVYCANLEPSSFNSSMLTTVCTLSNRGCRTAYVCAIPYQDVECNVLLSESITITPVQFCLPPNCSKNVTVMLSSADVLRKLFVILFYYGDEISRQKFRRAFRQQSMAAGDISRIETNPLFADHFNEQFIGEVTTDDPSDTEIGPDDVKLFFSSMSSLTVIVRDPVVSSRNGEPVNVSAQPSLINTGRRALGDERISTEFNARSTSPPVKESHGCEGIKNSTSPVAQAAEAGALETVRMMNEQLVNDATSPLSVSAVVGDGWSILPNHLKLTSCGSANTSGEFKLVNNTDRTLQFSVFCTEDCLSIEPSYGVVLSRSTVAVRITCSWNMCKQHVDARLSVTCNNRSQEILVELDHHKTTSQTEQFNPTGAAAADCRTCKIEQFQDTVLLQSSERQIMITNKKLTPMKWNVTFSSATYLKVKTVVGIPQPPSSWMGQWASSGASMTDGLDMQKKSSPSTIRVPNRVFSMSAMSGEIKPGCKHMIVARFTPQEIGFYNLRFNIFTEHSATDQCVITRQLCGQGVASTGNPNGSSCAAVRSWSSSSVDTSDAISVASFDAASPSSVSYQGLIVSPEQIIFPPTSSRRWSVIKLQLKNKDSKQIKVHIGPVAEPFFVAHKSISLNGRRFVKLPVEFRPADPGVYCGVLYLTTNTGSRIAVKLQAEVTREN